MDSPCGPGAPCRAKLEAMEMAYQRALQELIEKHEREIRELEEQKARLVQEEIQSAAKGKYCCIKGGVVRKNKAVASLLLFACSLLVFCVIFFACFYCDCNVLK